jgi:hypothetical protein
MKLRHEMAQLIRIDFRSCRYRHEIRRFDRWRQDMTGAAAARLVRRDSMALGAPLVGNPPPLARVALECAARTEQCDRSDQEEDQ